MLEIDALDDSLVQDIRGYLRNYLDNLSHAIIKDDD